MSQLSIVILAAGQGKRMYSALPKVLHPLGGKPLLARVLDTARALQPQRLVVVYGHGGEQVRAGIAGDDIVWVAQQEQLGTGHALKMALSQLPTQGQTLVLYGDVPLIDETTLRDLIQAAGNDVALLTDMLTEPKGYGRIVRDQSGIVAIVEEKDCNDQQRQIQEINTGMLVLPNARLTGWLDELRNSNAQGEYYLTDVIGLAVRDGVSVNGVSVREHWLAAGVNNKVQLAQLERIFQHNQAHALLEAGVLLADPARLDIRGPLRHGRDVFIDVNVVLEGEVILGSNVVIGANCVLKNVSIADGVQVAPFSHLDGASVADGCRIGPYARLRPGAVLKEQVHVGNFVEIKNSTVDIGSKVNHLTYIGDADIGQRSNIGAGTVTCNYDGVNKFRTVIGDRVFVGSGSMLVAPVTLENDATIGAGSVISRTAPADTLTVARARQISIPGWRRPEKK